MLPFLYPYLAAVPGNPFPEMLVVVQSHALLTLCHARAAATANF
jgi:hypothetical protein